MHELVHTPAWTEHVFVGAGDGPCTIIAIGARADRGVCTRWRIALRHRASAGDTLPPEAYAGIEPDEPVQFDPDWLPG